MILFYDLYFIVVSPVTSIISPRTCYKSLISLISILVRHFNAFRYSLSWSEDGDLEDIPLACSSPRLADVPADVRRRKRASSCKSDQKKRREAGKKYVTAAGKVRKDRAPQAAKCHCSNKCRIKFPGECRSKVCTIFWSDEYSSKHDFYAQTIEPLKQGMATTRNGVFN